MNLVKNRKIFFIISAIFIVPGLISLFLFGLKLSIEFTGGSKLELGYKGDVSSSELSKIIEKQKIVVHSIKEVDNNTIAVRTSALSQEQKNKVVASIQEKYPSAKQESFETVGPTIGQETELNALKAVIIASFAIMAYIAFAFRKVSEPVKSWKYGACAIVALLHDVLVVLGVFSILGVLFHVEVDTLFLTALLTVMGFSVHDTIVVFDRIRENLHKNFNYSFEEVVNNSLLETLNRSINTSVTVVIVLFALILFGGESLRWFVAALLLGIISGTYSSIFNASQLLVVWYEWDKKRKVKNKLKKT